jgi:hypothetical protein
VASVAGVPNILPRLVYRYDEVARRGARAEPLREGRRKSFTSVILQLAEWDRCSRIFTNPERFLARPAEDLSTHWQSR